MIKAIILGTLMAIGGIYDCDHELVQMNCGLYRVAVESAEDEYEYHTIQEHIEIHKDIDELQRMLFGD